MFYGSVHVDPGHGWFPHWIGFADERGDGPGIGTNHNLPLAPGSGDDAWLAAVDALVGEITEWGAGALVVSLGVDAAAGDPESPLEVTPSGYAGAGGRIGAMRAADGVGPGGRIRPGDSRRPGGGGADRVRGRRDRRMNGPEVWVGTEAHHGVASEPRQDLQPPPHWRLEAVVSAFRPRDPVVSPDGSRVLFLLDADTSDVWQIPVSGGRPDRLTTHRDLMAFWEDTAATWSPDGSRFAYVNGGTVHIAGTAGSPPRPLAEGGSPRWLDETRLLVTVDDKRRTRLAIVDLADPWPRPLTVGDGHADAASASADGSRVAYAFFPADDRRRGDIRLIDLATGEDRRLSGEAGFADHSPAIRPDGAGVAFVSERSGWNEVHLVGADGTGERRLTRHQADFSALAWSPDGARLAAVATRAGRGHLVTVDPESGEVALVAEGGTWSSPSWAGETLIAAHESRGAPPDDRPGEYHGRGHAAGRRHPG